MERLWKNAGATGRKGSERFKPRNGSTSQISFPPAATACPQNRMVRTESTVRVRQRASAKHLRRDGQFAMEADSELPLARVFRPASAQARLADLEWPALASRGGAHATDASRWHRRVRRRGAHARPLGAIVSCSGRGRDLV